MKRISINFSKILAISLAVFYLGLGIAFSQPLPPPGNLPPVPVNQPGTPPPPGQQPPGPNSGVATPPPPPGWGAPGFLATPPTADWMNEGTINVMATGYDTESVLVQIPLYVAYSFNGVNYNVTVLNSWNPFTQNWTMGVDIPANQTSYYFNGFNYNYYVNLPTGTFYFNL